MKCVIRTYDSTKRSETLAPVPVTTTTSVVVGGWRSESRRLLVPTHSISNIGARELERIPGPNIPSTIPVPVVPTTHGRWRECELLQWWRG